MTPKAWLLNLDAELELLRPLGYQPSQATIRACAQYESLALGLLDAGDVVLQNRSNPSATSLRGYLGVAWCPTPSAQRALRKAGATLAAAPSAACLQRVNHRRFSAQLGQTLPAALFTDQLSRALNVLQQPLPNGWVVKRAFGFAGRAVRRFGSHPTKDDVRWLEDGVRLGGVQLEPWQDILHEYSLHGYIDGAFNVKLGQPCVLLEPTLPSYERVDHQLPGPRSSLALLPTERHQLFSETERVANALIEEGYFGPFGIDAFAYTVGSERRFNPRSEINARYTLAYATGMGGNSLAEPIETNG